MDIKSCSKSDSETNKINVLQQSTTQPINKMIGNQNTETRTNKNKERQTCDSNINVKIPTSMSETNSKQFLHQTIDNNHKKHVMYDGISNVNNCIKIPRETVTENKITSTVKILHKDIIESSLQKPEEYFKSTISTQGSNIGVLSASEKNIINVHDKVLQNTKCKNVQSKHILKKNFENDCSTVVVDNPVQYIPESQQITNSTDTIVQLNVQKIYPKIYPKICPKICPKIYPKIYPKNSIQSDLSNQWNIIKKAMNSVKDNELRILALKALEDCGIGIEKHVPICLPEEHKVVHDTQVQTMVFGLLDPKSFIFINKDLENIQRINQISLYDKQELLTNSLHSNNSLLKVPLTIEQESDFDIDSFIKQIFKENSDAAKLNETLSVTKYKYKNLIENLKRDFESVKRYDQFGMLNIHNAVLSNNVHLVQRQLMILQHCKESVDILTENGMTSLELAFKYDVCSEIVKLLLKAGAQPVIPKYIHESALIIASKQSSPLLLMLIDQISDSKLLDQIDPEGFAALHYCSIHNNLEGIKALLSAGATIDLKDMRSGRTPLFHALDNGYTTVAQTLLKAGAVLNVTNYGGQIPLPIVSEKFVVQNIRRETT